MITPDQSLPRKPKGGMASLASNLSSRAGSLAHRSTEESLVPTVAATARSDMPQPGPESDMAQAVHAQRTETAKPATSSSQSAHQAHHPKREPSATGFARPLAGPEGRLEASGEGVVKWTLDLAPQLVMALNVWERDETKRLGQRVFRERMVDLALGSLPEDLDSILRLVDDLPTALRYAPGQQFGTRVRSSVRDKLLGLRPELRVAGIKNVRIRDVYSAAVYRYLTGLGIPVEQLALVSRS
jgi:hypothetical protein